MKVRSTTDTSENHTGQLVLEGRQHLTHGLGGTSGGGNDVDSGGTATTPILHGGTVNGLLGCAGVDGGHQTLLDTAGLHQDVADRGQAVGGARGVGDNIHGGVIVLGVVDTQNDGLPVTLTGGGDHDLLASGLDVATSSLGLGEDTG